MQSSGIDFFIYYHIFANDSRYSAPIHFFSDGFGCCLNVTQCIHGPPVDEHLGF